MAFKITIDKAIGDIESDKQFIAEKLSEAGKDDIEVRISSLGGNVDDGLSIHDMLKSHPGKVTAKLDGMVASAATVIAMAADVVEMSENAFFLVHKAMAGMQIFSFMNEDDIDELIKDLEAIKDTNQKVDLVMANIYAKKTGRRVKTMLNLMAEDKWLTASEAEELGFVDQVTSPSKQTKAQVLAWAAMVKQEKLPELPKSLIKNEPEMDEKTLKDKVTGWVSEFFASKNKEVSEDQLTEAVAKAVESLKAEATAVTEETQNEINELKSQVETIAAKDEEIDTLKAELEKAKAGKVDTPPAVDTTDDGEKEDNPSDWIAKSIKSHYGKN